MSYTCECPGGPYQWLRLRKIPSLSRIGVAVVTLGVLAMLPAHGGQAENEPLHELALTPDRVFSFWTNIN